ncbi:MAG: [acyl-carrier-protein] S-malonyltransferase [Thermodesulfobacteriota bacterium]|nr:[acyl-carrier-protein] S-malonyltransferase [Thermodesulfobacteriota bacterium]
MKKTAFLFPGQGSQTVGMGFDFYQEFVFVKELFEMASEICKINLAELCFKGPMEELTKTINLQPSVTAVNLACLAAVEKEGIAPAFLAGHSLGEYSALCASGVISHENTFRLVYKRGELMHRESLKHKGAMHAIIGLSVEDIELIIAEVKNEGIVSVANHNTKTQIVITGEPEAVNRVSTLASAKGAKAVPLKVSGAWHSRLIKGAENDFEKYLYGIPFGKPSIPVIHNVTAEFSTDPSEIRILMGKQLCSPVKWFDSIRRLMDEEVEIFAEIGPGRVLAGLLGKILPKDYPGKIYTVNSMKSFENFIKEVK